MAFASTDDLFDAGAPGGSATALAGLADTGDTEGDQPPKPKSTDDILGGLGSGARHSPSTDDLLGGGSLMPSAAADAVLSARRGQGTTLHGDIAAGLLGMATQPMVDVGTLTVNRGQATTGEKALAATRLALMAAGGPLAKLGAAGLEAAGVVPRLAELGGALGVGAAQGAASLPEHPIRGALVGTGLGLVGAAGEAGDAAAASALADETPAVPEAASETPAPSAEAASALTTAPASTDDLLSAPARAATDASAAIESASAPPSVPIASGPAGTERSTDVLLANAPAVGPTPSPVAPAGPSLPTTDVVGERAALAAAQSIPPAPEAPITEIDYTGNKPVVVNASAAPATATRTRGPATPKIDTSIPGREKVSAHDQEYARMPVGDLLDELHTQYGSLDAAASNPSIGGWTRFDDDEQIMRSGQGLGGAIGRQRYAFALQRVQAVERELARRGVGPDEIAGEMQLRRERALERPLDESEDMDLSFPGAPEGAELPATGGNNVGADLGVGGVPSGVGDREAVDALWNAAPRDIDQGAAGVRATLPVRGLGGTGDLAASAAPADAALGTARGLADAGVRPGVAGMAVAPGAPGAGAPGISPLRLDKFDVDPTGRTELAAEVARLDALGQLPKARVSFPEMRGQAMDFAREIGADPLTVDQQKLKNLTGPQIVGLKNVVSRNTDEITGTSKLLADPTLDADTKNGLAARLDALQTQRESLLSAIVTNTSDRARDLGFLRQISTRTLDPDVWEIQARRLADRPLSDLEAARVRGLANDAASICGGVAA